MADNTTLNTGAGGDTVRDLARQAGTVKTQVVQLDLGGASANAENLITAGQQAMANSVPVAIASNQPAIPTNVSSNGLGIGARPDGFLNTYTDPVTLLFENFETVDTVNKWTLGGTVAPTGGNGSLTIGAAATASATSFTTSKASFTPSSNGYLLFAALITFEAAATTGTNRFWGLGIIGAPTTALPITNGAIFEIDTTGALFGSVYANGVRTQTLALTKAVDGNAHRYAIYYKASRVYFEIDSIGVGSIPFPVPSVAALTVLIGQANSATVTGANTLSATLLGLGDTGRNAQQIADGVFAWRKATIKAANTAVVAADTALSVGLHPSSPLPAGNNPIGIVTSVNSDNIFSGNITTQNLNPSTGVATAGSIVPTTSLGGHSVIAIQITGTYTGVLTPQVSIDGVNWVNLSGVQNVATGSFLTALGSGAVGILVADVAGCNLFRLSANAAVTGTAVVTLRASVGQALVGLDAPIPAGTNGIGSVTITSGSIALGSSASIVGDVGLVYRTTSISGTANTSAVQSPVTPAVTTVKATSCRLIGWQLQNSATSVRSVKLFNIVAPTLGTSVAAFEIDIPAGGFVNIVLESGIGFSTACTYAVTAAKGLTDNTATGLAVNDVTGAFYFA